MLAFTTAAKHFTTNVSSEDLLKFEGTLNNIRKIKSGKYTHHEIEVYNGSSYHWLELKYDKEKLFTSFRKNQRVIALAMQDSLGRDTYRIWALIINDISIQTYEGTLNRELNGFNIMHNFVVSSLYFMLIITLMLYMVLRFYYKEANVYGYIKYASSNRIQ